MKRENRVSITRSSVRCQTPHLLKVIFMTVLLMSCTTFAVAQNQRFSGEFVNEKATDVISNVMQKTGVNLVYNTALLRNVKVTIVAKNEPVSRFLTRMLAPHGLEVVWQSGTAVIRKVRSGKSPVLLKGRVTDQSGDPLPGVSVTVAGERAKAVTDVNGFYQIQTYEQSVVRFSFIGMKSEHHIVSSPRLDIAMEDDVRAMDDVVVTGYQQLDRRNLTSSITSKDMSELETPGVSDLSKMLEGKIPDLISSTGSGEINATSRIRIRGTSTLIGNREPLWVLDGIILTDPVNLTSDVLNDPDYVNRIGNAIAGVNPQDIKRVDVLKDAAATALYGTRAANGVIVVTTKSGREGKPIISYSGQFTVRKRPYYTDSKINLMNSAERVAFSQDLAEQHYQYPNSMPLVGYEYALSQYYSGLITREQFLSQVHDLETQNTDWFSLLTHNSFSHDHSVSISGGSDKIRYYTSVGYTDQDDVINNTMNRRYTAMGKIDVTLSSKLQFQFNISGYLNDRDYSASEVNLINYAYNTSRTIPAYNPDGSLYYYSKFGNNGTGGTYYNYNILNENANSGTTQQTNSVTATLNLRYQPFHDLFFNAVFSGNVSNGDIETWYGEQSFHSTVLRASNYGDTPSTSYSYMPYGGELSKQHSKTIGWTARLQANYNKFFGPQNIHNINFAAGFEASSSRYTGDSYTQRGFYKDRGLSFATNISDSYSLYWSWMRTNVPQLTDTKNNIVSVYATLSYSFKDLFTLNANGRYDGSNKFGSRSNEKLLPIWSVSGNANISRIFNVTAPWIDDIRLKSSYGEQGNMLDNQTSELVIRKGGMNSFYNEMTSNVAYFANPDLRWEKTRSFNIGVETSLLGSRMQFEAEYYHKQTSDAFMSKTIADINGYTSYIVNSGTITNSGFNFSLTATPIKLRNFYWIFSGNVSKMYNKVKTAPGAETYSLNDFLTGNAVVKGQPVGTFYSYKFLGLSPVDGGPIIEDWEDRQKEISEADEYTTYTKVLVPSGKRDPDITGSVNNTFTYKQWRLSATLLYNFGAKTRLFRMFDGFASNSAFSAVQNISRDLLNRWQKPGDEQHTNIPAIIGSGNAAKEYYSDHWSSGYPYTGASLGTDTWTMYDYSTARVVSADYVKLSTLSLTYEFTQNQLRHMGMSRLAITLSAYNLKTWCDSALRGQTPTQGGFSEIQLSDTPSYTLGVAINF